MRKLFVFGKKGNTMSIIIFVILVILLCFVALYYFIQHNYKIQATSQILASTSYLDLQEQKVNTEFRVLMDQAVADAYITTLNSMSGETASDLGTKFTVIDDSGSLNYQKLFIDNLNSSMIKLFAEYKKDSSLEKQLTEKIKDAQINFDGNKISVILKNFFVQYKDNNENYANYTFDVVYFTSLDDMGLLGLNEIMAMKKTCSAGALTESCVSLASSGFNVVSLGDVFDGVDKKVFYFTSRMKYFISDSTKGVSFEMII